MSDKRKNVLFFGFIILGTVLVFGFALSARDEAEAEVFGLIEPNDLTLYSISIPTRTDIEFQYYHNGITETLTLDIIDNEIVCSQPAEKAVEIIYKTMWKTWGSSPLVDIDDLPVRFKEPNEIESIKPNAVCIDINYDDEGIFDITIDEPNEPNVLKITEDMLWPKGTDTYKGEPTLYGFGQAPGKARLDLDIYIPTWPNYIELEKDLIVDMSHKNDPNYPCSYYPNWLLAKGTKIYFKDD